MTQAVVQYREEALTAESFETLERTAGKYLSFRERVIERRVWQRDEYGDPVQVTERTADGMEIMQREEPPAQLLESLKRPARPMHTILHLTRLAQHLPYGRGMEGFQVVLEDLARDLEGVSEFAILKTCERFRLDSDLTFFPASALLVRYARGIDWSLSNIGKKKPKDEKPEPEEYAKTDKQRRRGGRMLKLAIKAAQDRAFTKWEQRFFDGFKKGVSA